MRKRHGRVKRRQASAGSPRERGLARKGIGRMMRGTRTGCGGLRDGWARPAKRVPAQCSRPRPNHIVPSPPLSGAACCSGTNGGCRGVWASGDSTQTCSECRRRPTVPYHSFSIPDSPCPDRLASAGTLDSRSGPAGPWLEGGESGLRTAKRSRVLHLLRPIGRGQRWVAGCIGPRRLSDLWRSPAHRLRPVVIAQLVPGFSTLPGAKQITKLPPHARLVSGRERLFPLWLALLQLGRLLSRLKVGTQAKVGLLHALPVRLDARCLPTCHACPSSRPV